jgi:hypothetical protein
MNDEKQFKIQKAKKIKVNLKTNRTRVTISVSPYRLEMYVDTSFEVRKFNFLAKVRKLIMKCLW